VFGQFANTHFEMVSQTMTEGPLGQLSPQLQEEFDTLKEKFTVDTAKLKEIIHRFEEELKEGLEKDGTNIVRLGSLARGFITYMR
jgi:hexokinase